MQTIPPRLLHSWPRLWRFPRLLAARGQEIPAQKALEALLGRYAAPDGAGEIWRKVLEAGHFETADSLLVEETFLQDIGRDFDDLESELARERLAAQERVAARCEVARHRARRLRGEAPPVEVRLHDALDRGSRDPSAASQILERIETELSECEKLRIAELRKTVETRARAGMDPGAEGWGESLGHLLETGEIEIVEALLDAPGLDVRSGALAGFLARPPAWPYSFPAHRACRLLLDPEGEFFGFDRDRWLPRDPAGRDLLELLGELLPDPESVTPNSVGKLADALTRFFGDETTTAGRPAEARDGFLWATVRSASSAWLPALAARHGRDLPLAVPDPDATGAVSAAVSDLILLFDPWDSLDLVPHGALKLSPELFLRSLAERQTRLPALLFEIGRQIPLARLLPATLPSPEQIGSHHRERDHLAFLCFVAGPASSSPQLLSFRQTRATLAAFLDVAGLAVDRPEPLDRLAYYSGGHPAILCDLLRKMFELLLHRRARRGTLEPRIVDEAWQDSRLRDKVSETLRFPLWREPLAHLMLAILIYETLPTAGNTGKESIPLAHLIEAVDVWKDLAAASLPVSKEAVREALRTLHDLGFAVEEGERFALGRSAGMDLLVERIHRAGVEDYILRIARDGA